MPNTVTITALHNGKALLQRLPMPPKRSTNERERTSRMPMTISTAARPKLKETIRPRPSKMRLSPMAKRILLKKLNRLVRTISQYERLERKLAAFLARANLLRGQALNQLHGASCGQRSHLTHEHGESCVS
jgi:hypothetical protein